MAATLRPVPTVGDDESSVVYPAASPAVTPTDDPGAADSNDNTASVVNAVAGSDTTTHKVPSTATSAADAVAHLGKCLAASGAAIHHASNPDNFVLSLTESPEAARRRKRRCVDYGFSWMDTLGGPVALGSYEGNTQPPSFWTLGTPGVEDEFLRRFPELGSLR